MSAEQTALTREWPERTGVKEDRAAGGDGSSSGAVSIGALENDETMLRKLRERWAPEWMKADRGGV